MAHYTTVTVFGGTGFIGRYVIDKLADAGVIVRVATRSPASAYFLRTAGTTGQVVPFACNIHDDASVAKAVEGTDWVINLIGILAEGGKQQRFDTLHHLFPKRLAAAAANAGMKRLVHVSALGASLQAESVYASTKAKGEEAILQAFPDASILRPSIVFGPEDNFFNRFARMAAISPFLPLIGGGKTLFQPVYVDDVASAVIRCCTLPHSDVKNRIFELGGDEVHSFRHLLKMMLDIIGIDRKFATISFGIARIKGAVLQHLPGAILTVDQVAQLRTDNIVSGALPGLRDLGITPETLESILPTYLGQYRTGGNIAHRRRA